MTVQISRVGKSYSLTFTSGLQAREFSNLLKDHDLSWKDPRDGVKYEISPRGDIPVDVRACQRAASKIDEGILTLLRNGGKDLSGYKLG
eukprot:2122544-Pyramimonas_sp.AAC.1